MTNLTAALMIFLLELFGAVIALIFARGWIKKHLHLDDPHPMDPGEKIEPMLAAARRMSQAHDQLIGLTMDLKQLMNKAEGGQKDVIEKIRGQCAGIVATFESTAGRIVDGSDAMATACEALALCGEALARLVDESVKPTLESPAPQPAKSEPTPAESAAMKQEEPAGADAIEDHAGKAESSDASEGATASAEESEAPESTAAAAKSAPVAEA